MIQKFPTPELHCVCNICSSTIIHPICQSCLKEEIHAWLTLYPSLGKEVLPHLKVFIHNIEKKGEDMIRCVTCKNKRAAICPHCFSEHTLQILKNIQANHIILKEFLEFFNFDFDHTAYSQEAEKYGAI
jgi:hypothetical protein